MSQEEKVGLIDPVSPLWCQMGEWNVYKQYNAGPVISLYYRDGWHVIDGQSAYFCSLIDWWEGDSIKPVVDIAEFINYTLSRGYGVHIFPLQP